MDPTVQEALSSDIHFLGDLLGKVIQRLAGQAALDLEEEIRAAAKDLRASHSLEKARQLRDRLEQLEIPELRLLIRAFTLYFDLVNLAEQQARVRALRKRARQPDSRPSADSAHDAFKRLCERGVGAEEIVSHLQELRLCPVFTAHPSEARRRSILEKLWRIADKLDCLERVNLIPPERERAVAEIVEEIETLWLTDLVPMRRPSVIDEVWQGLHVVEGALFEVIPRFFREVETALRKVYPDFAGTVPCFLRFGSWIGGDRDGNPNVTHSATAAAVLAQQELVLSHYREQVQALGERLSQAEPLAPAAAHLRYSLQQDGYLFPELEETWDREPYRKKCCFIAAKLDRTLDYLKSLQLRWSEPAPPRPPGIYFEGQELLKDVRMLAESLQQNRATAAVSGAVQDLLRLVEVFGVHLLKLDIRQHSRRHEQAVAEIFHWCGLCPNYTEQSFERRLELLENELQGSRPLVPVHLPFTNQANEIVETFRTVAALLEWQCPEAIDNYIISMAAQPAHILEVLLLAKEARLFQPTEGISRLNIAPLFETLEALQQAPAILKRLFQLPVYRRHLELRGNRQEVMIGYSDSSKESGFLQSVWALYGAQRRMAETGKKAGIAVHFFHGRGGAIGRGGGPANRAILAQPHGTVGDYLRMTEQGEVIADRYGYHAIAERHLEQVFNALLQVSFPAGAEIPDPHWEQILDRLAPSACRHYRALVYETPEFLTYFEQATPIDEITELKIASRPARRSSTRDIEELRAIPWVFSWMQSRHTLPGWYGLGSALDEYLTSEPAELETLQTMYQRWPFWRTVLDNAQMILAKGDMIIARLYADLLDDQELAKQIYDRIEAEYQLTVKWVCQIMRQEQLLDHNPVLQHSIQRRNPYVDPLSFIQLVLLKRLRTGQAPAEQELIGVLESINGLAAGLKNTG